MTNGGIIEGDTSSSDLSPTTSFGSGATRMQMQEPATIRGNCRWCATPLLNLSMKYILLAVIGASVSYGQQFSGTGINVATGQIEVISGSIDCDKRKRNNGPSVSLQNLQVTRARVQVETDRVWEEIAMSRAQAELEKQTRLLRKIANE